MSAVSDFATKVQAFFDRQNTAIATLGTEMQALNDKITALQNSPGTITPADQALLDGIQTSASGVATKLEALDGLVPPVAPAAAA